MGLLQPTEIVITFEVIKQHSHSSARLGRLATPHGEITTPAFMPVGTQATVKALSPEDIIQCGSDIILGNTYHRGRCKAPGPTMDAVRVIQSSPSMQEKCGKYCSQANRCKEIADRWHGAAHIAVPQHICSRTIFVLLAP